MKNSQPVYQKWWFWVIIVLIVITSWGRLGRNDGRIGSGQFFNEDPAIEKRNIEKIVGHVFGSKYVSNVNYIPESHYLLIQVKGKKNVSKKMTTDTMMIEISNALRQLRNLKDIDIYFNILFPLQDANVSTEDRLVIKAAYYYETRREIDWNKFLWENIPATADEWWMHPSLET